MFELLSFQLAISPTPRNAGEPIPLGTDTQLAMKVEGVIQHGSKPGKTAQVKLFSKLFNICLVSFPCGFILEQEIITFFWFLPLYYYTTTTTRASYSSYFSLISETLPVLKI